VRDVVLIKNGLLALGIGCGAAVAQLAWWSDPGPVVRLVVALPFLTIAIGVYRGGTRWLVPALISISTLLFMILLSPLPDAEQPVSELSNVTAEFLEVRFFVTTIYALAMLWQLSARWGLGRFRSIRNGE
jgi:hypothetical protein